MWVRSHLEDRGDESSYSVNAVADELCDQLFELPREQRGEDAPYPRPDIVCIAPWTLGARGVTPGGLGRFGRLRSFSPASTLSAQAPSALMEVFLDLLQEKGVRPFDRRLLVNARHGRISL